MLAPVTEDSRYRNIISNWKSGVEQIKSAVQAGTTDVGVVVISLRNVLDNNRIWESACPVQETLQQVDDLVRQALQWTGQSGIDEVLTNSNSIPGFIISAHAVGRHVVSVDRHEPYRVRITRFVPCPPETVTSGELGVIEQYNHFLQAAWPSD